MVSHRLMWDAVPRQYAMPEIRIDAVDVVERKADERGRVALGTEFADDVVEVAVIRRVEEQSGN